MAWEVETRAGMYLTEIMYMLKQYETPKSNKFSSFMLAQNLNVIGNYLFTLGTFYILAFQKFF